MASDVADGVSSEAGLAAAADTAGAAAAADNVVRRNANDLEEVMRRRRETCKEFESAPQGSTADASATFATDAGNAEHEAVESKSTDAGVASMPFKPKPRQTGDLNTWMEHNVVGATNGVVKAPSDKFVRAGQKSVSELHAWMDQMRKRCEELESVPEATVADAQATDNIPKASVTGEQDTDVAADDSEKRGCDPVRRHRKDAGELQDLLNQRRNRCEVLESTPEDTTADAKHEVAPDVKHEVASEVAPDVNHEVASDVQQPISTSTAAAPAQSDTTPEPEQRTDEDAPEPPPPEPAPVPGVDAVRVRLQGGAPLSDAERVEFWSAQLCPQLEGDATGDEAGEHVLKSSEALGLLLNGQALGANEEVLFDANAATESEQESMNSRLATAFGKKYVTWLCGRQRAVQADDDGKSTHMMPFFAQLLRYHFPESACAVEAVAAAARAAARAAQPGEPVPSGLDLVGALDAACRGPLGLAELLFTPQDEAEAKALQLVCDFVVLEDEELLLVFIAVVCVASVEKDFQGTMEELQARLRKAFVLSTAADCDSGVQGCVAHALSLLERTPVTLLSALACGHGDAEMPLPICSIAPDEVLHHIYETPGRNWRLIVVDARMLPSKVALPICMRLGPTAHKHRRQVLRDTPEEESIHLCLMGDGAPLPGDDAFELCRYLVGPNVQRRHVSVVDGGWPAVAKLAYSLRLHLMPVEPEAAEARAAADAKGFQQAQEKARAKVAEVAKDVARDVRDVARDVAEVTAAGQKAAKKMLAGAGRALQRLHSEHPMFGKANSSSRDG